MSVVPLTVASPDGLDLSARLARVLRPEFAAMVVRVDPGDPVFGRGPCSVSGCERTAWTRLLCMAHYSRWRHAGQPALGTFVVTTGPIRPGHGSVGAFDLTRLGPQGRAEVGYVLQRCHDDRWIRVPPSVVRHLVELLAGSGATSLLDRPVTAWVDQVKAKGHRDPSRSIGFVRYAYRHLSDLAADHDLDAEYAADRWEAGRLGIATSRPRSVRFDGISPRWLREATKRWARHRLGSGKAFSSLVVDVGAVRWFARYLSVREPDASDETVITRETLEGYLAWLAGTGLAGHTRGNNLVCLRVFLDACRRHRWLPRLPVDAALYGDDLPRRPDGLPRFIPEHVMSQLEHPDNLARLPDATSRHLVVLLIETGLRANDACVLPFNPVIDDSVGWPCLRYYNAKMRAEQLVPLSAKAAEVIRAQQALVRDRWPAGATSLFPAPFANPDGHRPFTYATLRERLARWQADICVRDDSGRPYRATAHQFRHTLGTRLINSGVPQHVVQRLLGHASPQMTARYAHLHDTTVRAAFADYCQQRVNVAGERLDFDPDAPTAGAEWIKHNLARVQASLPNGYCGRPPQQDCPHPNACLTCPDFQTTPEFLDIHRHQRAQTATLIATAEANGQFRLVANHRLVAGNLDRIITALEAISDEQGDSHD